MDDEIKEIREEVTHCRKVLNGLVGNEGFDLLVADKRALIQQLDEQWQTLNLTDEKSIDRFLEIKYAKLAAMSFVSALELYQVRLDQALEAEDNIDQEE